MAHTNGEDGDCHDNRDEANAPRRKVQQQAQEWNDRDAQAEGRRDALDPVDLGLPRRGRTWEQRGLYDVSGYEKHEDDSQGVADVQSEEERGREDHVAHDWVQVPRLLLKCSRTLGLSPAERDGPLMIFPSTFACKDGPQAAISPWMLPVETRRPYLPCRALRVTPRVEDGHDRFQEFSLASGGPVGHEETFGASFTALSAFRTLH